MRGPDLRKRRIITWAGSKTRRRQPEPPRSKNPIELDETPIGTFVELEGPAEAIDRAAEELGYSKRDYVLKNYLRLYMEDCRCRGEEPRHMLFPKRK